jgi:probable selenium-dependent hydroxylase accessory protein YqeC
VVVAPIPLSPIALTAVADAFGIGARSHIALVGGGGKSTLLHALGSQVDGSVVLTCTTKMGADQHLGRRVLLGPTDAEVVEAAARQPVMVWSSVDGSKAIGVDPARCDAWFGGVDHIVVEADGSRRRPFKAPAGYEPVVPSTATIVISVIGADALGRVIADQCHRPLRVAALAECRADRRLEPWMAATVILHERGAAKAVPPGAELAVAINKVDAGNIDMVEQLVGELLARSPTLRIVAISAQTHHVSGTSEV